ncbi:MAG: hypothetical protein LBP22_07085 [Deltaproteobacteria bacterium]|jgi:hypothetical protein|nr:hypothetical protein [Deltaproteobacteria bacterium]
MKKLLPVFLFVIMLLSINFYPASVQGQQSSDPGSLEIWNSNSVFVNQGMFAYQFTVDTQGMNLSGTEGMTNLTVETNFGRIEFLKDPEGGVFNGSEATRYGTGILESDSVDDSIAITKVTAQINGKAVDLTKNISVRDFQPLKIAVATRVGVIKKSAN